MMPGGLQSLSLITIAILVGVAMVAAAAITMAVIFGLKYKKQRNQINRRILPMHQEITAQNVALMMHREHAERDEKGNGLSINWLDELIMHSGKKVSTSRIVFMMLAIAIAIFTVGTSMEMSPYVSVPLAVFIGFVGPVMVLRFIKSRRLKKFSLQFTEAIELIVRSLKAGHPVPTAIQMVSKEMPDPIGSEFATITNEVSYGSDLVTAIKGLQARIPDEDLPLFVTAISIQSTTGGNLSIILSGLADVLRQRVKLRRKVKAAAAEGRASAMILNSVPLAVMLFISLVTPKYYGDIIQETFIIVGLASAFGWMMVGNLMMYKMMHFKV